MANARNANVWVIDTAGTISQVTTAEYLVFIPGSDASRAAIQDAAGDTIWETGASASRINDNVCIRDAQGIQVTLEGTGTKLYIYVE